MSHVKFLTINEPSVTVYTTNLNIQQFYVLPTHTLYLCFVWISEQTAIISLYSINWLVCITETECLLRGTDWIFKLIQVDVRLF
jgi:hypothetical protein